MEHSPSTRQRPAAATQEMRRVHSTNRDEELLRPENLGRIYRQRLLNVLSATVEREQERLRQAVERVIAARRTRDQKQITPAGATTIWCAKF